MNKFSAIGITSIVILLIIFIVVLRMNRMEVPVNSVEEVDFLEEAIIILETKMYKEVKVNDGYGNKLQLSEEDIDTLTEIIRLNMEDKESWEKPSENYGGYSYYVRFVVDETTNVSLTLSGGRSCISFRGDDLQRFHEKSDMCIFLESLQAANE